MESLLVAPAPRITMPSPFWKVLAEANVALIAAVVLALPVLTPTARTSM